MSAVRPEFGPTLPEVLGPRLRALPRPVRIALALAAAIVVAAAVVAVLRAGEDRTVVTIRDAPVAFNLTHDDRLRRVAPRDGELLRLAGDGADFAVAPLALPPYRGDASGTLPVFAERLVGAMERHYDGFLRRTEGRANINRQQGYQVVFQFRRDGATWYGRRVLLLPSSTGREGADILVEARRTAALPRAESVGNNGPLKVALRSFRFGTERP